MADQGIKFARDYGLIVVSSFILGKKAIRKLIMVLDTGSFLTLIKPEVADLLGDSERDSRSKFQISSPIGVESGYRINVKRFEVGGFSQNNLDVGVIPIHDSYGIDGLIGLNFLEHFDLKISFKNQTISFL